MLTLGMKHTHAAGEVRLESGQWGDPGKPLENCV